MLWSQSYRDSGSAFRHSVTRSQVVSQEFSSVIGCRNPDEPVLNTRQIGSPAAADDSKYASRNVENQPESMPIDMCSPSPLPNHTNPHGLRGPTPLSQ